MKHPCQPANVPGLNVTAGGRSCASLTGRFDVLEAVFNADGTVARFATGLRTALRRRDGALRGSVRINASV